MACVRTHLLISGRVQGVCFRAETCQQARTRGLSGWVRNLADGRVEAVFEGPADAVRDICRWCHQGPPGAMVNDIQQREETPLGDDALFDIRF